MKRLILSTALFVLIVPSFLFSQINWNLDFDSANFAFLSVDFDSYNFEGGYFTKYNYISGLALQNIPLSIVYNSPTDYGNISFAYSANPTDTIFAADIWWAGQGHITFPNKIDSASQFTYDSTAVGNPMSISYFNYMNELPDSVLHEKADSAWESVKKLSILKTFHDFGNVFRVGLYLYAPAVGQFRPEVAKWIIFLYSGQLVLDVGDASVKVKDYQLFQNYPNPFNPKTNIEFVIGESQNVKISIYNMLGEEKEVLLDSYQQAGKHRVVFDGTNYSSGVYLYKINTDKYSETKKLVLLK